MYSQSITRTHRTAFVFLIDGSEEEMSRAGFIHNNLKGTDLRWCDGKLIPIRYHDAQIHLSHRDNDLTNPDREAFTRLRMKLRTSPEDFLTVCDKESYYHPMGEFGGHLWVSNTFEGLVCVEDESGMGLIDKEEHYVLPPEFEIVRYDPVNNVAHVRKEGLWALYDHNGKMIRDFVPEEDFFEKEQ